jgi:hypothetical protein
MRKNLELIGEMLFFLFVATPLCFTLLFIIEIAFLPQTIKNLLQCTKLTMFRHFRRK